MRDLQVIDLEIQFQPLPIRQYESVFDAEVVWVVGVDDRKLARLQVCAVESDGILRQPSLQTTLTKRPLTSILDLDAEQKKMGELDLMHRTDAALSKEDRAVEAGVLVKDAVLDVVRKKILDLDGGSKGQGELGIASAEIRKVS